MSWVRSLAALTILGFGAAACAESGGIDDLVARTTTTTTSRPPADATAPAPVEAPGVIAVGGSPLRLIDSTGEVVEGEVAEVGLQPTWSRDGSRLIAAVATTSGFAVDVFDPAGAPLVPSPPRGTGASPYFFFSWSDDHARVAALGPGRFGTSLTVLDGNGAGFGATVEGGSVFVAWEPGGHRLLIHADRGLSILEPAADADTLVSRDLGEPGTRFYAPKWIPGTADILYVDESGRLVRRNVETDELEDLGPVRGAAGVSVHPDGGRAIITHGLAGGGGDGGVLPASFPRPFQVDVITATVEEIDLSSGARIAVTDLPAFWAEWSPDGSRLLLATLTDDPHAEWSLWDGADLTPVATWVPTQAFFTRYMVFSDQYVEQPRLWAPDSSAFVYPAVVVDPGAGPVDRIHVSEALAGSTPVEIGPGSVGFWSPAPRTP